MLEAELPAGLRVPEGLLLPGVGPGAVLGAGAEEVAGKGVEVESDALQLPLQ